MYQLLDDPRSVYKRYHTSLPHAADVFDDLMAAGNEIRAQLPDRVDTVWPTTACGEGSTVEGYVMRKIPNDFYFQFSTPYASDKAPKSSKKPHLAALEHALPVDPSRAFRQPVEAKDAERLEIVRLVGQFLDTLHRRDLVYGDLSLKNILWALNPTRVLVMDLDSVHRITSRLIDQKDLVSTPDWEDPDSETPAPLGFDLDRYKYALLVYRLLVAHHPSAPLPDDIGQVTDTVFSGLSAEQTKNLRFLFARAAGPQGSRPPISEWLSVLDGEPEALEQLLEPAQNVPPNASSS